jgi:hypothetical protein
MSVVSTKLSLPIPTDQIMVAIQDIIDQRGWRVHSITSSEIVIQERDYDALKGAAPKIVASMFEKDGNTEIQIVCSIFGAGPFVKKIATGFMGQFVNSLSLRAQTSSVSINPTVQVGEGQTGGSNQIIDRFELLRKAKELLDMGVLTDQEFQDEKRKILASEM